MTGEEQANGTMEPEASTGDAVPANPVLEPAAPKKRVILIVAGVVVLVVLLAGAAFVGAQLLNGQGLPEVGLGGGQKMMFGQGGKGGQMVQIQTIPAKELPQQPADAKGLFDHRKDNSFFIGTGQVRMTVMKDQSGKVTSSSSHDGPTVEVVVTPQTTIYQDVTMKQFGDQPPTSSGTLKVQQVVESGTLDDIGQNSVLTAWGSKTGDRIIAQVLVYTPPPVLIKH